MMMAGGRSEPYGMRIREAPTTLFVTICVYPMISCTVGSHDHAVADVAGLYNRVVAESDIAYFMPDRHAGIVGIHPLATWQLQAIG